MMKFFIMINILLPQNFKKIGTGIRETCTKPTVALKVLNHASHVYKLRLMNEDRDIDLILITFYFARGSV